MNKKNEVHFIKDKYFTESSPPILMKFYDYKERQTDVYHFHDFHELVYVRVGSGMHIIGGKSYPISAGDVFLIKPGIVHAYQGINHLKLANFLFLPERLTDYLRPLQEIIGYYVLFEVDANLDPKLRFKGRRSLDPGQMLLIEKKLHDISQEQTEQSAGWQGMVTWHFLQILTTLCRIFSSITTKQCQENIRISQVIRYIETQFANPITLGELTEIYGCSIPQFLRVFRKVTGRSPIQYLLKFRLEKAACLLRTSELSIMEISSSTGFTDSNYFTKIFSREFGQPPRLYRKQVSIIN